MAINPGHNGSAALVVDGKLEYYIEEERMSRMKRDANPFRAMLYCMENYHIDALVIGGTGQEEHRLNWTGENSYQALVRKFNPDAKIINVGNQHHMGHVGSAFYGSGFDNHLADRLNDRLMEFDDKEVTDIYTRIVKDIKEKVS